MYTHSFGNIDNQLDVGIIVIIRATGNLEHYLSVHPYNFGRRKKKRKEKKKRAYLDVLVSHSDIVCVPLQVLWRGHDGKLYGALIAKGIVGPFPDGSDFLDSSNAVVCD